MIKQLYLENWKSFHQSTLFIDPLTILIGTNASGKSNVLDALFFLHKSTQGISLGSILDGDAESTGMRGGSKWAIAKGQRYSTLRLVVDGGQFDYEYEITLESLGENKLEIKSEHLRQYTRRKRSAPIIKSLFSTSEIPSHSPSLTAYFNTNTQGRGKKLEFRRSISILSQCRSLSLAKHVQRGIEAVHKALGQVFILEPIPSQMRAFAKLSDRLLPDGSNVAGVLAALPKERQLEVEDVLTGFLSQLPEKDIQRVWAEPVGKFQSDAMLYCSEKWALGHMDTFEMDARGMSDGTLRFLAIMTALLTMPEGSLLVVEEIDNGLHPSRAHVLVKFLKEQGQKRHIDVLCTTHNPALLDALGNEMIVFMSAVYREPATGWSKISLLEDIDTLPRLIAQGSIGKLSTSGALEESLVG